MKPISVKRQCVSRWASRTRVVDGLLGGPSLKAAAVIAAAAVLVVLSGCAPAGGGYKLLQVPTENTKAFDQVEVAEVEAGFTKSQMDPGTQLEVRAAIIRALKDSKIYRFVASETDDEQGVLLIAAKIVEFDTGSRMKRWAAGPFAGKAYMEVSCRFIKKETNEVIATGTFLGEVRAGLFGGGASETAMANHVGAAVAKFLKKGR